MLGSAVTRIREAVLGPAIRPVSWQPPPIPARAGQPSGEVPLPPLRVHDVGGTGPEDVLVDPADGSVLTGVADGRILRLHPETGRVRLVANTGGRPLGLEWLPDGRLLVCDSDLGLLAVDVVRRDVEPLVVEAAGRPLRFCNNAAVAPDGSIWFSESSARFGLEHWKADILEHGGTGRLLRRDPDGAVHVVAEGMHFPNGVAIVPAAADGGPRLYVAETGSYLLSSGPCSATAPLTPFVDNLPGFPDNLAVGSDGLVWVALASPRNAIVDRLAPRPGVLRRVVWALPEAVQPKPADQVWVLALDPASGAVVHDLQGVHPRFGMTTGVREHDGTVWLGSLVGTTVAAFDLPGTAGP